MTNFFVGYKFIEAAGGIVKSENSFLFIKRNGLWDIPKGKIEKKETPEIAAIREIQEECGITGELIIRIKIIDTYHTYKFKNKSVLKKTHWYYLDYFGDKSTKPQLEEGITEIQWLPLNRFSIIESTTYPSIRDVLTEFGKS
jgi:8-oxo-dGTP pyrophosphatase MutT (NUDIX family)